jgi:hypothetical protein
MLRRQFMTAAPSQFLSLAKSSTNRPQSMQFFGTVIDRIADDAEFRLQFVDYARERLGLAKFNLMLYHLIQDAKPQVRSQPLVMRMIRRVIWGSGERWRPLRRFRR